MIFTKAIVSAAAIFMPLGALAAPADIQMKSNDLANLLARDAASEPELAARQGTTCAFGGNRLCTTRCFIGGNGGGYCNSKNVCVCNG